VTARQAKPSKRDTITTKKSNSRPSQNQHAMKRPAAVAAFAIVSLVALASDLLSKHYVFESMLGDPDLQMRIDNPAGNVAGADAARAQLGKFQRRICPGVKFTLSTNPGVVFGVAMPRLAVAAATVATVAIVGYFFAISEASAYLVHVALALILGGAMGNLYDRLFSKVVVPGFEPICRQVRDFIDCSELHYVWIFNLADAWLVIGVALMVLHWCLAGRHHEKAADPPSE